MRLIESANKQNDEAMCLHHHRPSRVIIGPVKGTIQSTSKTEQQQRVNVDSWNRSRAVVVVAVQVEEKEEEEGEAETECRSNIKGTEEQLDVDFKCRIGIHQVSGWWWCCCYFDA